MGKSSANSLNFLHCAVSHQGKIRKENQDAYGIFSKHNWSVFVVCDGMGGAKGGRIASTLCLEVISKVLENIDSPTIDDLSHAISEANRALFSFSKRDLDLQGMGTTLVLFASLESGCYSIHVGDSRLYRLKNNQLQILTRDHTYAQELIDSGTLSESSAKRSPISHLLTKAVGTERGIAPEIAKLGDMSDDDILLLSSDGLYAHLNRQNIEDIILGCTHGKNLEADSKVILEEITNTLINKTLSAGATDNTTVLAVKGGASANKNTSYSSLTSSNSGITFDLADLDNDDLGLSSTSQAILYSAHDASGHSHNKSANSRSLLAIFLLGISIVLGFALWIVISNEEGDFHQETRISKKLNSAIQQILKERSAKQSIERLSTVNSPVLMEQLHAYGFTQEKFLELSSIPPNAPQITIMDNPLHEDLSLAPIEWKNEEELIGKIKTTPQSPPKASKIIPNSDQLGPSEKIDIVNKKNILRESLWDIDLRLTALEISTPELEEKARSEIINQKNFVGEDLDFTKMAIASIKNKKRSLQILSKPKTIEKLLISSKELAQKSNSLENLSLRYMSELQSGDFYTGLIKDSKNQLEIANRLSASNRKKQALEALLREEFKNVTKEKVETFNEHIAVLILLEELLNTEDKRVSRALGFIGAYTTLGKDSKISIWESLIQKRNELYSDYNLLEKSLPSEEEFKEQVRLIQNEQDTPVQ